MTHENTVPKHRKEVEFLKALLEDVRAVLDPAATTSSRKKAQPDEPVTMERIAKGLLMVGNLEVECRIKDEETPSARIRTQ